MLVYGKGDGDSLIRKCLLVYWFIGFLVSCFLVVVVVGFLVSKFPGFLSSQFLGLYVSMFIGFLVSEFQKRTKCPFNVFWKILIPYSRFARFC